MVKLTVAPPPELYAKDTGKKLPPIPCSVVEIPLEKEVVVRRPFWTKGTICSLLVFLTILAVGALLGFHLSHAHRTPRCHDWGPNCEMKGPPVPPAEHYDGPSMEPQSGDDNSQERHGSHGRHHGPHHGGDGDHQPDTRHPDGDRHGGHSSSSSSEEERGSVHERHHEHADDHPEERPVPPPDAPVQDDY
ncbi:uncharacterized protein LOC117299419 [Asterias rubens]|uniref:uncharacterized protein LOC117299419 n=1 Tax=Asterias rubens TaxID=7604 RepID=UPI0014555031|nr:uncharacterized protein LOC117299419 [Asterias rubens]